MLRISPLPLVRWRRLAVRVATGSAVVIGLWCIYLALTLPSGGGWDVFWVVLDAAETATAATTAILLVRRSPLAAPAAAIGAALLVIDAVLDVATAPVGLDLTRAVVQAVLAELPLAAAAVRLAVLVRTHPSRHRPTPRSSSPSAVRQ